LVGGAPQARLRALVCAAGLALASALLLAGPAAAQATETAVRGTITRPAATGTGTAPVEGVLLTVLLDGRQVGESRTDAQGAWSVALDKGGIYEIRLDTSTLPEDVRLRDPSRDRLDAVDVRSGQVKNVLFPLVSGESGPQRNRLAKAYDRIADLAVNGIKVGAIVGMAAVGLSLIFGITGLVNFAHAELVTIGAVATWWANASSGGPRLPLVLAAFVGVAAGAASGFGLERGLFRPLRRRRMGGTALMVVTIGLSQFLRHVILLVFGGAPRRFADYTVQRSVNIGPISMQPKDIVITLLALGVLLAVGWLLRATRTGKAMRAVADNRALAEASGIDVDRIILVTWIAGAALAALGGIFYGTSQTVSWDMGFTILLSMFAAVILGGLGSAYGAMVGGLVIGVASEVSTYWLELEFKYVTALAVLIIVVLVRPQGILGVRERVG
jgi:branched-chain amino acid transport system permease protein